MKTIIDAVNELLGDLNNVSHIKDDDTYHCNVNYNDDSGWWCSRGVYGDFVCTIDDFEVITLEMTFHSRTAYDYIDADKTPLQPAKPKAYTQDMCDAGELPSAGMECMIYYSNHGSRYNDFFNVKIKILAVTFNVLTFHNNIYGLGALALDAAQLGPLTLENK
jgi:hypothetical protein